MIEPEGLLRHFAAHPPQDFSTVKLPGGMPGFALRFDLATTMPKGVQGWLTKLRLRRWLQVRACFAGATSTEFVALPRGVNAPALVRQSLAHTMPRYPFFIIKDLPQADELIDAASAGFNRQLRDACNRAGFILVDGQALAYVPIDFSSIADFLAGMPRARRKDIKRKLKSREQLHVTTLYTGNPYFADDANLAMLYSLYLNVYRQGEIHFDLLTPDFFRALFRDASLRGIVFLYHAQDELIGFNVCIAHHGMLLDKYIGLAYPQARDHNLYAVSWFRNLEYALEHGLHTYVAGWTDPEIKRHLGARFTFTQHAVYIRNPILRATIKPLRRLFESDRRWHEAKHDAAGP